LISQYGIDSIPVERLLDTQNKIVISIFSKLIPELNKPDQELFIPILHEIALKQSVDSNSSNELIQCLISVGGKITIDECICNINRYDEKILVLITILSSIGDESLCMYFVEILENIIELGIDYNDNDRKVVTILLKYFKRVQCVNSIEYLFKLLNIYVVSRYFERYC